MMQIVPQLHQRSANDICLKIECVICIIVLNNGDKLDNGLVDEQKKLNQQYEKDISIEKQIYVVRCQDRIKSQTLDFQGESKIVLLNLSKRKRFTIHNGEITFDAIQKLINGEILNSKYRRIII